MKTLLQCDFDGTITEEDASFFLLDTFADGDWRRLLRDYQEDSISVGAFNTRAFAMVKADRETMLRNVRNNVRIRPGFEELVAYCAGRDFRFVIVSNGLHFYIEEVLAGVGLGHIEVHAAQAQFPPEGVTVQYTGPDGAHLDTGLKEEYIRLFLKQGYRVLYAGNGRSDVYAARHAYRVFATGELLEHYQRHNLRCQPFDDLTDVVRGLELL